MRTPPRLFACLLLLGGCGPEETLEPAELDEVCGTSGPFRVLALAPDERLWDWPIQVGDRVLYLVGQFGTFAPDDPSIPLLGTTVWSTGPCGESPVQLATGIDRIFMVDAWPDVPLGCTRETGDVVSLDPTGARPPHVVFPDVPGTFDCGLRWTKHGLLSVTEHDEELGALELHPYPTDPYSETATPVTLLDPIQISHKNRSGPGFIGWVLQSYEDFALALTADDTLVRVDLADRTVTELRAGVGMFDASREGNYVLWQDPIDDLAKDEPYPVGAVSLRDMTTGTDTPIAETSLRYSIVPARWADEGALQLALGSLNPGGPTRIFRLPGLESIDIGGQAFLLGSIGPDRWLSTTFRAPGIDVIDLQKRERRPLFDRGTVVRIQSDVALMLDVRQCCVDGSPRDEGPVWRLPLDFSPPQRVARRATRYFSVLKDGRIVTPLAIDTQMIGTLAIVDPDTQEERQIDDRVFAPLLDTSTDNVLRYSVADGARSGVYLVRLPARESPRRAPRGPSREPAITVEWIDGPDGPLIDVRAADEPPAHRRLR